MEQVVKAVKMTWRNLMVGRERLSFNQMDSLHLLLRNSKTQMEVLMCAAFALILVNLSAAMIALLLSTLNVWVTKE